LEETEAKIVTGFIAVCRTVNPKEYKAWKLKNDTTTLGIQSCFVDDAVQLARSRIAADLLVFGEVAVSSR
jgi:hypothetical protein